MRHIQYDDWKTEFDKRVKAYVDGIDWETILFEKNDFGVIGDELQNYAYIDVHEAKFDDGDYSVSDWDDYDSSCEDRTAFEADLKELWDEQLELRSIE